MKLRASRTGTVVSPAVRVEGPRARRVACRAGVNSAWRSERAAAVDRKFRYFVDATGRQHFNFVQQIWLRPQVEMAVTPVMTVALETLAVNLLSEVTRRRDCAAAVGLTSRRVIQLAPRFCQECLLTAQANGWVIPRASVRSWLAAHSRNASRPRR
jgi:hypothetical protein